jgi:ribonuclease D
MSRQLIVSQSEFNDLCAHIREMREVAFDTEFVSEFTYRPELCLLQFATRERSAAVDPYEVRDLSPWWEIMTDPSITVVIHGGREEVRFCVNLADQPPPNIVDIQIAEGLRSPSFPLGYTALVQRVVGVRISGKETRTDWRRRPLTDAQIEYALEDVQHVLAIWDRQRADLVKRNRLDWSTSEFQRMVDEVAGERTRENWRRIPGLQRLNQRELAVLRELYQWRDQESQVKDRPARKTLRDDLLIELAKRQPRTTEDVVATRDMNRSDYRRVAGDIVAAVQNGLKLPNTELPAVEKAEHKDEEHVLGQLLAIALANLCLQESVAMQLVGSGADLRHLVRWHVYGEQDGEPPRLMQGWRAEVCGELFKEVLDGKIAFRVADPHSEHPLKFVRL